MTMDTLQAIFTRRSVRAFRRERVSDELMRQILDAAAASPSGGNVQAWGFVVIHSAERVAALRSLAPGIIGEPDVVVAVCLDAERATRLGGSGGDQTAWLSLGMAIENILLAAQDQGLGGCPVGSFHTAAVSSFLELPEHLRLILLVALGYPQAEPPSPGRRSISEVCFAEKWGVAYEG